MDVLPTPPRHIQGGLEAAWRCVLCGMCLPSCPTYGLAMEESESPRGRIALMRALGEGLLEPGPAMWRHFDSCIECRRCESVCPAGVPFGALMDRVRAEVLPKRSPVERVKLHLARLVLARPWLLRGLRPVTGWVGALRDRGLWPKRRPRALALFPPRRRPAARHPGVPVPRAAGPRVALFRGCVAEFADYDTLTDARLLLEAAGFQVVEPKGQVCCGALHRHAGDPRTADSLLERNRERFAAVEPDVVVSAATGCGAVLAEDRGPDQRALGVRHQDLVRFLSHTPWPRRVRFHRLNLKVLLHAPCSLPHAGGDVGDAERLLARIPGVQCVAATSTGGCCGAGGRYMLTHPDNADALVAHLVEAVRENGVGLVLTTNIGCRLHLEAALRRVGEPVEVLHPVTLLARHMETGILRGDSPSR